MKYCIKFNNKNVKCQDEIDEIILKYPTTDIEILNFLDTRPEHQRIILDLSQNTEIQNNIEIFHAALKKHKNLTLMISFEQDTAASLLEEENLPYFFNCLVDKWDMLMHLRNYHITDIYIGNELGFELKEVAKLCKQRNIKVRVFPNVAQKSVRSVYDLKSFFIRPEDIDLYEPYVDVCEFFGPADRYDVLYTIYTHKEWRGNLKELIIGLHPSIYSNHIAPIFGEQRINCGKRCYKGKCLVCEKILSLATTLEKTPLEFEVTKNE